MGEIDFIANECFQRRDFLGGRGSFRKKRLEMMPVMRQVFVGLFLEESGDICEGKGECRTNEGKNAHPIKGICESHEGERAKSVAILDQSAPDLLEAAERILPMLWFWEKGFLRC
jgi:hypothetical protein